MVVLAVGDVVGSAGCVFLRQHLPALKRMYNVDFTIVNGENSADGNGITPHSASHIFTSGADVITTGNHVFRRKELHDMLDENDFLLRPANYPARDPGKGWTVVDTGRAYICVINLIGTVFMDSNDNPFYSADAILKEVHEQYEKVITIVDFHAEATSEKRALAMYLDGRISALYGTHTHIQTADEEVLPQKTGYLTDAGMTGPMQSILGVDPHRVIKRYLTKMPVRFDYARTPSQLNGVIFDIDTLTTKANFVKRVQIK
ncbi:MAG TPA: TIGR00282 family metallophosphoesterase [Ruminococcaceae bacterium]|nr:TIGR00282 family metallophosphoesterase [Oscillospiraceae bacterium]